MVVVVLCFLDARRRARNIWSPAPYVAKLRLVHQVSESGGVSQPPAHVLLPVAADSARVRKYVDALAARLSLQLGRLRAAAPVAVLGLHGADGREARGCDGARPWGPVVLVGAWLRGRWTYGRRVWRVKGVGNGDAYARRQRSNSVRPRGKGANGDTRS